MKKYIFAPAALALIAFSLSGCVWWHHGYHDHDHGYYGHGGGGLFDQGNSEVKKCRIVHEP